MVIHPRGTSYSEGTRGDTRDFALYGKDYVDAIRRDIAARPAGEKRFLFGHSMSTAMALAVENELGAFDRAEGGGEDRRLDGFQAIEAMLTNQQSGCETAIGAIHGDMVDDITTVRSSRMKLLLAAIATLAAVLSVGTAVVAMLWASANLPLVPAYGDTVEYLRLAELLRVDEYRGILYPLVLRAFGATATGIPAPAALYLFQVAVNAATCVYLAIALNSAAEGSRPGVRLSAAAVPAAATVPTTAAAVALACTAPLALHFHLTVLTDSLASSALLACLAATVRLTLGAHPLRARSVWLHAAALLSCGTALQLLRVEKWMVLLVMAAGGAAYLLVRARRAGGLRSRAVILTTAALLSIVLARVGRAGFEDEQQTRAPMTVALMLSMPVAAGRVTAVRPRLPPSLQDVLSEAEAQHADVHPNHMLYYLIPLLRERLGGWREAEAALAGIAWAALREHPGEIVANDLREATAYTLAPLAWMNPIWDWHGDLWNEWNYTRMAKDRPALTRLFQSAFFASMIALLGVVAAASTVAAGRRYLRSCGPAIVGLMAVCLAHSALFAIVGPEFNVRYALAQYQIVTLLASWLASSSLRAVLTNAAAGAG